MCAHLDWQALCSFLYLYLPFLSKKLGCPHLNFLAAIRLQAFSAQPKDGIFQHNHVATQTNLS